MRIALISDIHANFVALQAVTGLLDEADQVVCLGDYVGYYCQVNEVLDYVRRLEALCILGNHDHYLLHGAPATVNDAVRFGIDYADRVIDTDHRRWLESLPLTWEGVLGGHSMLFCHGSPWNPLDDYLYADSPALAELARYDRDLIAVGQTHRPLVREGRPQLVNPGSIGQSRHAAARACLAVVDTTPLDIRLVERPYDPTDVTALARRMGAGEWIAKHLA